MYRVYYVQSGVLCTEWRVMYRVVYYLIGKLNIAMEAVVIAQLPL